MKDKLSSPIDEAEWGWLKPHLARGAVILVAHPLNLAAVAEAVVQDSSAAVQQWIADGLLGKPSLEQITAWDATPSKRFLMAVVQPYVLVQEVLVQ